MFKTSTPYNLRLRTFSVWPRETRTQPSLPLGAPQNSPSADSVVWRVERLGPTVARQSRAREVRVQVLDDETQYPDFRKAA